MKRKNWFVVCLAVLLVLTLPSGLSAMSRPNGIVATPILRSNPDYSRSPSRATAMAPEQSQPSSTAANWGAWHEYVSHKPTPGTGCFNAKYPNTEWQTVPCASPATSLAAPSYALTTVSTQVSTVGNTVDYVAQSSGTLIGSATGSFPSVTGLASETDVCVAPFLNICTSPPQANAYSLQVNAQIGFPVTFNGNPTTGWEQFIFDNAPSGFQGVWIEFWLFGYYTTYLKPLGLDCPSLPVPSGASGSWLPASKTSPNCAFNSNAMSTPFESPTSLASLSLEGIANAGGNDEAVLCVSGGGCITESQPATFLNLYQQWKLAEFNVVGFGNGSQAQFNSGTSITVLNALKDSSGNAITPVSPCPNKAPTGETNNLNLLSCSSSSAGIQFTESSFDFTNTASPSDITVLRGGSTSYTVSLGLVSGPADSVMLSVVSGLPSGATASFVPKSVTPTRTSNFQVTTSSSGGLGDFSLIIQAADGHLAHNATVNLHIYGFTVTASPSSLQVLTTGSNTYSVSIALTQGSSPTGLPTITLGLSGLPSGTTDGFNPVAGSAAGFTSILTITTTKAPAGTYTLTITGADSRTPEGGARTIQPTLIVLTPAQALQLVVNQVNALQSAGVLTRGQATSLISKLNMAIQQLNMADNKVACNQLTSFVSQVNSYVSEGVLTQAQANLLLGGPLGVLAIMAGIPC